MLVSDVQKSVVDTKTSMELNAERILRKNNIVAYNVPENEANSKSKDKESIIKLLKEITNIDVESEIVI